MSDYSNPSDPYHESLLVKYGATMSGEDFHCSNHYFNHIGLISGIVCLFGLASIIFLVAGLYLRTQYEEFKLKPFLGENTNISNVPTGNLASEHEPTPPHHHDDDDPEAQQDSSQIEEDPNLPVQIVERIQLEEQMFGQLPQAIAESVCSSDGGDDKKQYYDDPEEELYALKLQNKLSNNGVEHCAYGEGGEEEQDEIAKKKELLEADDDAQYFPPGPMYGQPSSYHHPASYLQSYQHVPSQRYSQHEQIHYIDFPQPVDAVTEDAEYRKGSEEAETVKRSLRKSRPQTQPVESSRRGSKVSHLTVEAQSYPWNFERKVNAIILYSLCLAILVFSQFYAISASYGMKGLQTVINNMDNMKTYISAVSSYTNILITYGTDLLQDVENAEITCTYHGPNDYFTHLEASLATYRATAFSLGEVLSPLSSDIETVEEYQKYFAQGAPLYILWVLGMLLVGLVVYFSYCESRMSLKATIAFGTGVFVVFILSGAILMSLTMMFADLCSDPSYNVVTNLPSTNNWNSIASYYSTCNPEYNSVVQTDQTILQTNINYMYNKTTWATSDPSVCPGDPNLSAMSAILLQANQTMKFLTHTSSCQPIQSLWFDTFNTGVCSQFYTGIFYAWGAQLLTSFLIFWLIITASITYQFYPNLSKLHESTTDHISGEHSEDGEVGGDEEEARRRRTRDEGDEKVSETGDGRVSSHATRSDIGFGIDEKSDRDEEGGGEEEESRINNRHSAASHAKFYPETEGEFVFQARSYGDDGEESEDNRHKLRSIHELRSDDEALEA